MKGFFSFQFNPIQHGLLEISYCMGGIKMIPPYQNPSNKIKVDENACFGKNEKCLLLILALEG